MSDLRETEHARMIREQEEATVVEMCEWCGEPVNNGRTHGEGQCFDIPAARCPRCGSEDVQPPESVHDTHLCASCGRAWDWEAGDA